VVEIRRFHFSALYHLALDQLAEINRRPDLKRAGQARPSCNEIEQRLRCDA
jgi:hypothetical protein